MKRLTFTLDDEIEAAILHLSRMKLAERERLVAALESTPPEEVGALWGRLTWFLGALSPRTSLAAVVRESMTFFFEALELAQNRAMLADGYATLASDKAYVTEQRKLAEAALKRAAPLLSTDP